MKALITIFILFPGFLIAQSIKILAEKKGISFRGLSVVNKNIIWISGSNGTVGKSVDGGIHWNWMVVKDHEKKDFRDIEAFDDKTAIVMAISEPGILLKTYDGGEHWNTVFTDSSKGIFLDAMDFRKNGRGIVIGDPIQDQIYVAQTNNYGDSWEKSTGYFAENLKDGEAMFASSGTNIRLLNNDNPLIITGGKTSRLWLIDKAISIPIIQGCNSCGGNSLAYKRSIFKKGKIVIVGGDFANDTNAMHNCIYSNNMGKQWISPTEPPHGYRSCVEFITSKKLICCGTSGVDISNNGGQSWELISKESFHVCKKGKSGGRIFLAGKEKIAMLIN